MASCLQEFRSGRGPTGLLAALGTIGVPPDGGVIVNLGAALVHPGPHQASANDDAWNFFFKDALRLNLTINAFEGQPRALRDNAHVFNVTGGRFELRGEKRARANLVNEYADPYTLVNKLHDLGVPRDFLLLKIDIDSIDLHAFDVVTRSFRPSLVVVEKGSLREGRQPPNLGFAALKRPPGVARPYDGTKTLVPANHLKHNPWSWVPCAQSDSISWFAHSVRRGYAIVQAEAGKNFLMVRSEHRHLFPFEPCANRSNPISGVAVTSDGALASARAGVVPDAVTASNHTLLKAFGEKASRLANGFAENVERRCALDEREYTLEVDGVCCPKSLGGEPVSLPRCVCLD